MDQEPELARRQAIARVLAAKPGGVGAPAAERGFWAPLAATVSGRALIQQAEAVAKQPVPPFIGEQYEEFFKTGNRSRYQREHGARWRRLRRLVLGECLDGRGRFVQAIAAAAQSLCGDPSWLLPAHDRDAEVFGGGKPYVDLAAAMNGYDMALAIWLLADRLPAEVAAEMRENVMRRVIAPTLDQIHGRDQAFIEAHHWWARKNHNWNAVCTAGTVGSILVLVESREERAAAVAWAERNVRRFLSGFATDGYCSEGIGYWSYGFGHFVLLVEAVLRQTDGKVDWLNEPRIGAIVQAAVGLEVANGIYPAFADAGLGGQPDPLLLGHLARRGVAVAGEALQPEEILARDGALYSLLSHAFPFRAGAGQGSAVGAAAPRTWLPAGGVYIGRPAPGGRLAVAWKGGHNAEHHNHNDVGTTLAVVDGHLVLVDPGSMVYTRDTFSGERYRFPPMNSFGHAVPVIDGILQLEGATSAAKVIEEDFTPERDLLRIDFRSCYPVEGLRKLERGWIYQRSGGGALVIEDSFEAGRPIEFATALVGLGQWHESGDGGFAIVGRDGGALGLAIDAPAPVACEVIAVPNAGKPATARLGIRLCGRHAGGRIMMKLTPVDAAAVAKGKLVPVAAECPAKLADPRREFRPDDR